MSVTSERAGSPGRHNAQGSVAIIPLGFALSIFLALTFLLCAIGALIPGVREIHLLGALYPWLDWSRPGSILAGLAAAFAGGWYVALGCGLLYNAFSARGR